MEIPNFNLKDIKMFGIILILLLIGLGLFVYSIEYSNCIDRNQGSVKGITGCLIWAFENHPNVKDKIGLKEACDDLDEECLGTLAKKKISDDLQNKILE